MEMRPDCMGHYKLRDQVQEKNKAFWPTPMSAPTSEASHNQVSGRWRKAMAERMWRTPQAGDADHGGPNARDSDGSLHLSAQVMYPTPTDASKGGGSSRSGNRRDETPTLQGMARKGQWPTPTSDDANNATRESGQYQSLPREAGGQLNPTWVETLMGFPAGYTDLSDEE